METAVAYATDAWAAVRAAVPFVVLLGLAAGILATGGLRLLGGPGRGPLLAAGGGAVAMVVVLMWYVAPGLPPDERLARVPWFAVGALALGFGLAVWGPSDGVSRTIVAIAVALGLWWLVPWGITENLRMVVGLVVFWGIALWRMHQTATRDQALVAHLVALAAGFAGVALVTGAPWGPGLAAGLAAAALGQLFWVWDRPRFPGNALTVVGGGGTVLAVGTMLMHFEVVPLPAMVPLLGVLFADGPARAIIPAKGVARSVWAPLAHLLAAAAPVAVALGVAYFLDVDHDVWP